MANLTRSPAEAMKAPRRKSRMTSPKKVAANRANAEKSTGPTSRAGKQHSSKNARRHGLSVPIIADPSRSAEIDSVAREIAGPTASEINFELAKRVAAAQLDLLRVRRARLDLITNALADEANFEPPEQIVQRQRIIKAKLPPASTKRLMAALSVKPTGAFRRAMIIATLRPKLDQLDRYERRALSRRRRAMRTYDTSMRATLKGRKSKFLVLKLMGV
jgi:hypothetical protein